jgi:hypothetical protein
MQQQVQLHEYCEIEGLQRMEEPLVLFQVGQYVHRFHELCLHHRFHQEVEVADHDRSVEVEIDHGCQK